MLRCTRLLLPLLCCATAITLPAADEFDQILAESQAPERFAEHRPQFSVVPYDHTFQFSGGPQTWSFWLIKDHDRIIAYVPKTGFHGGTIFLLTHDPAGASPEVDLPSERFHIDTARGCAFRTDHFLPTKDWGTGGEHSAWEVLDDGTRLQLTRTYTGTLESYKWELDTRKQPMQVDHQGVFTITCEPRVGYMIAGSWKTGTDKRNQLGQYVSLYPPDMSNPWVTEGVHERVVTAPVGGSGYIAHANNHTAIDASDDDKGRWTLRDGGFTAYLDQDGGWSWTATIAGGNAGLSVCNVHADQDLHVRWPDHLQVADNGLTYHTISVRLLRMPPEATALVWDRAELAFADRQIVVVPVGRLCDFEDQPVSMGERHIGMAWGGGQPTISTAHAHSGSKSLEVRGTVWPTMPQVVLKPDTRYRMTGWFKVLPATEADLAALEQRHAKNQEEALQRWEKQVRKAKKKDREPPAKPEMKEWTTPEPATAFITGHLYRWSPHNHGDRVLEQTTTKATVGDWQQVELEFTSPDWGPFIDIRFVCANGGTAYLDDFAIVELPAETAESPSE